jgi:signal transduction histidine kinase
VTEFANSLCDYFIGDIDRIKQVLMNLISNATKFVPKVQGQIIVAAKILKKGAENFLSISVSDNGPGIA